MSTPDSTSTPPPPQAASEASEQNPAKRDSGVFDTERLQKEIAAIQKQDPAAMNAVEVQTSQSQSVAEAPPPSPPQILGRGHTTTAATQQGLMNLPSWTTSPTIQLPPSPADAGSSDPSLPSWDARTPSSGRPGTEAMDVSNPFASSLVFGGSDGVPVEALAGGEGSTTDPPSMIYRGAQDSSSSSNPWV